MRVRTIFKTKMVLALLTVSVCMSFTNIVWAGAGHDHGESQFSGNSGQSSFTLPQSTIDNLDIQTETAQLAAVPQTVRMLAQVKLLPEKQAVITPRFAGKVQTLYVKLGDQISKGQNLVTVNPLTVGSGPVTIKAPVSGVLGQQNVVTGQIVQPGDVMMQVSDRREVLAKGITYDITGIDQIKVGQPARLYVDAIAQRDFSGEVQRIDQSIDEDSRTFSVYALIPNDDLGLLPHMQGALEITLNDGDDFPVLSVPRKAVLGSVGQNFIYVRDGNYFEKRDVTLGLKNGQRQEIISGVFPDEEVVIQGNYQLQYITPEGQKSKFDDHGHAH